MIKIISKVHNVREFVTDCVVSSSNTSSENLQVHDSNSGNIILQAEKFLKCDWLRAIVFEPTLKYFTCKNYSQFPW